MSCFRLVELLHGGDVLVAILFVLGLPGTVAVPVSWFRAQRER